MCRAGRPPRNQSHLQRRQEFSHKLWQRNAQGDARWGLRSYPYCLARRDFHALKILLAWRNIFGLGSPLHCHAACWACKAQKPWQRPSSRSRLSSSTLTRPQLGFVRGQHELIALGYSQFAREFKGMELRSTAGNCAGVRTPQLAM